MSYRSTYAMPPKNRRINIITLPNRGRYGVGASSIKMQERGLSHAHGAETAVLRARYINPAKAACTTKKLTVLPKRRDNRFIPSVILTVIRSAHR